MRIFNVVSTSRPHYNFILCIGFLLSVIALFIFPDSLTHHYIFWGCLFLFMGSIYLLGVTWSKEVIVFSVTSEYLQADWEKHALFSKKKNRQIAWTDIETYVYEPGKKFDAFKLVLKGNIKLLFSIAHEQDHLKSFGEFYRVFLEKVGQLQQMGEDNPNPVFISQGKTFYETTAGLIFAFLAAGGFIVYTIYMLLYPPSHPARWGRFVVTAAACFFYLRTVWTYRKKKTVQ